MAAYGAEVVSVLCHGRVAAGRRVRSEAAEDAEFPLFGFIEIP